MQFLRRIAAGLLALLMLCGVLAACTPETPAVAAELRDLTWAVGTPLPTPEDFVASLPEGASVRFAKQYTYTALGDYHVSLIVTDEKGGESEHVVRFSLVQDTQAPTLTGVGDLSVYLGDGVSYRAGVTVTDNCDGKVTLEIDSSQENLSVEGSYPVLYTATDAAGNQTKAEIMVWVYRERVTEDMLFAEIDRVIDAKNWRALSHRQQAEEVYDYVYNHVAYGNDSDKNDWVRAAYDGLRTGQGDCYTYFSLSKAFFARLGVETMDIQRTEGISVQRHYWNYVNIGTTDAPQWYHFDACPIKGEHPRFGFLLTDEQVNDYTAYRSIEENGKTVSNFFYAYDAARYPKSAVEIINPYV